MKPMMPYQIVKSSLKKVPSKLEKRERKRNLWRLWLFRLRFECGDTSTTSGRATLSAFPREGRNRNGENRHVKYNAICSLSIRIRCTYGVHMFRSVSSRIQSSRRADRLLDEENKLYTRAANSPTED